MKHRSFNKYLKSQGLVGHKLLAGNKKERVLLDVLYENLSADPKMPIYKTARYFHTDGVTKEIYLSVHTRP